MSTPIKPWEAGGSNFRSGSDSTNLSIQSTSKIPDLRFNTMASTPPPLPPRPNTLPTRRTTSSLGAPHGYRGYPSNSPYVGGYGSYGGYGGCGMYGNSYGGYGGAYPGYGQYGYHNTNDANSRLMTLAEESTRPAFESIESVVRAFGSVSFMLESTLNALHGSFRAALGVADHLSHLRNILSALSVFRLLQWCLRQLRRLFGLKYPETALGGCWSEAVRVGDQAAGGAGSAPPAPSQWPLRAFIGIVISGSYLAWRLLSYVVGSASTEQLQPFKVEENETWVQGKDSGCLLVYAVHNFTASVENELSFRAGDRLVIAPKSRQPYEGKDWLLAAHLWSQRMGGKPRIGLVPSNYIRAAERRTRVYPTPSSYMNPVPPPPPVQPHVLTPDGCPINQPMMVNQPQFSVPPVVIPPVHVNVVMDPINPPLNMPNQSFHGSDPNSVPKPPIISEPDGSETCPRPPDGVVEKSKDPIPVDDSSPGPVSQE